MLRRSRPPEVLLSRWPSSDLPATAILRPTAHAGARSLGERFGALRNLRLFLHQVWQTSPWLTTVSASLRLVRALLPVVTLYIGKLIIDEALRLVAIEGAPDGLRAWWDAALLDHLLMLLALEFGLAVLADVLGRLVSLADSLLTELFTNATSIRLMAHAATLDLEDFEDAELRDRLERARRQTMGRRPW